MTSLPLSNFTIASSQVQALLKSSRLTEYASGNVMTLPSLSQNLSMKRKRMMKKLVVFLFISVSVTQATQETSCFPKLQKIQLKDTLLGHNWKRIFGLIIPSFKDLSQLDTKTKKQALILKKNFEAINVKGVADFSFSKKGSPLDTVTCRIFIFESTADAKAWWKKKI